MPVFPRSPKDSRKIVKMKREVPVAKPVSLEAAGVYAAEKKNQEQALGPNLCPAQPAEIHFHLACQRVTMYKSA